MMVQATKERVIQERLDALKQSPVRGLRPITEVPIEIAIEDIELDPSNPGSATTSRRYERREESMLDSYDILDGVVYPVIVCEHPDPTSRYKYMHIDGAGRLTMLRAKGVRDVKAIIYRSLDLNERICFRETLNAAQEPFDAASIIQDLRLLAEERGVSLNDRAELKTLVRDLPARVQARHKDLILLANWAPEVIERMGEATDSDQNVIGLDQLRGLNGILDEVFRKHLSTTEQLGGKLQLSVLLARLFEEKWFADEMRSQEGIRKAKKAIKQLPSDHSKVNEFLTGKIRLGQLQEAGQAAANAEAADSANLVKACGDLATILVGLDADDLTDKQRKALERTLGVLKSVLP